MIDAMRTGGARKERRECRLIIVSKDDVNTSAEHIRNISQLWLVVRDIISLHSDLSPTYTLLGLSQLSSSHLNSC